MEGETTAIAAGGAGTVLDMSNGQDRGLVRQTIANRPKRWRGVSEAVKDQCILQLKIAMEEVGAIDDQAERVKARCSIAKTLVMIEGQNQKDEHVALELTTPQQVNHTHTFHVPPPRVIGEKP